MAAATEALPSESRASPSARGQSEAREISIPLDANQCHGGERIDQGSSQGSTAWHGMDSVEYMQNGGYSAAQQFPEDHASFLPFIPEAQQSQDGIPDQRTGADGNVPTASQLFGDANSSAAQGVQLAGALDATKNRFVSLPTPPDSSRRLQSSRSLEPLDMQIDASSTIDNRDHRKPEVAGTGDARLSPVKGNALHLCDAQHASVQGLPDHGSRLFHGGMADDEEFDSPSPLVTLPKRMFVQQGSPTPGQRALSHAHKSGESGTRSFASHRPSQSLGQAGSILSAGLANGHATREEMNYLSAPVSPTEPGSHGTFSSLIQFSQLPQHLSRHAHQALLGHGHPVSPTGITPHHHQQPHPQQQHPHQQQHVEQEQPFHAEQSRHTSGQSLRSISPSNSIASTSMTSLTSMSGQHISPMASSRLNTADASFGSQDTSIDSLSNTASLSASCASSTSDELLSHDFGAGFVPPSMRMAKRKRKLLNLDRKMICDFQQANPDAKQDTIAARFGIERSTVSKILKYKQKWLAIDPTSEAAKIAKHRTAKFPEVEDRLTEWVAKAKLEGKPVQDVMIRQEALRIAQEIGLTVDKFKASGGWIEKFRERNQLPKASSGSDQPEASVMDTPADSRSTTPDEAMVQALVDASASRTASPVSKPDVPSQPPALSPVPAIGPQVGAATPSPSSHLSFPSEGHRSGQSQTTPTSNQQKRQYETMATSSAGPPHLSPLHDNLARMQFSQEASQALQSGLSPELAQSMGVQHTPVAAQSAFHFPHAHSGQPLQSTLFFGPGASAALASSHGNPFLSASHPNAVTNAEPDGRNAVAPKRRRAGTDGSRLTAGMLGSAFGNEDNLDSRAAMGAFQFPATPDSGVRQRQSSFNGRVIRAAFPLGSPASAKEQSPQVGPCSSSSIQAPLDARAGDGMVNVGTSTTAERQGGQSIKARRKGSASPVKRTARKSHLPGASSPLTRSPHGIVGTIEDDLTTETDTKHESTNSSNSLVTQPEREVQVSSAPASRPSSSVQALSALSRGDQSIVTAEQAQQSLDLVLRFLGEQSSNFVPSSHFVVFGHLQANIEQLIRDRNAASASSRVQDGVTATSATGSSPSSGAPSRRSSRHASPVINTAGGAL